MPLVNSCPSYTHTASRLGVMPQPSSLAPVACIRETSQDGAGRMAGTGSINNIPMVVPGPNLPPISKKMAEQMQAGHFIDFAELPPAKGRSRMRTAVDGQVVLVQAAELFQSRRLISDLATWSQCFAIYAAVMSSAFPDRAPTLWAYMAIIAKAKARYKWPSWVVYDINFRHQAAGTGLTDWSKVDPSLYSECFNGMALSAEGWCSHCYSTEHTSMNCMHKPTGAGKRPLLTPSQLPPPKRAIDSPTPICRKYNILNGDCSFGATCRYLHSCEVCTRARSASSQVTPEQGVPSLPVIRHEWQLKKKLLFRELPLSQVQKQESQQD